MAIRTGIRLISYSKEIIDGQPIFASSNCLPAKALKYEPAGHAFHAAALKRLGCEKEEAVTDEENVATEKEQSHATSFNSYSSKAKKKSGDGDKQLDHYALLGLSHLRYLATEEQIKKSYRELALKCHPDKQAALLLAEKTEAAKEAKKEEIENHFKAIKEAYKVLSDPVRRRVYDSTDEFDDEIPGDCAPQDFFKVFGAAFMRNGRWSVNQPIPFLGDDNTPFDDVVKFYDFWYSFKSWREFPQVDEYDPDQAESREDKRWMERQNGKRREKARKEENSRVRSLVDNAHKRDPRILRRRVEEKAEKLRKKEAKVMAKKMQEEEAARKIEEERRQKEEEKKQAAEVALQQKKIKEKEKKLLRKERSRLRTLSAPILTQRFFSLVDDDVETLCMSLDIEKMRNLCDRMGAKEGLERAEILQEACGYSVSSEDTKHEEKKSLPHQNGSVVANGSLVANGSATLNSPAKKEKPWGKEEIELLRKGIQKYPKGTSRRWEVISEHIGTERSVEEILKATKTVLLQKPDANKAFDSFLEKRKPVQSIVSPLTTRDETGEPANAAVEANTMNDVKECSNGSTNNQKTDNGPPASNVDSVSEEDAWSAVQEKALIQALKTFPKEASQRWERVATAVPGKTVGQCKKKFASLKESFRTKKTTV